MILAAALLLAAHLQAEDAVVHVDDRCRIFTQDRPSAGEPYTKPKFRSDHEMCRIASEHHTSHWEQTIEKGIVKRTRVEIMEKEYVFRDTTGQTLTFVLDQSLPDGWTIDSDPQPSEVVDQMATFRVIVQPGETVRLHVGERK